MSPNPLRNLPSVHELLENPALKSLVNRVSRSAVVSAVGTMLDEVRREVQTAATERTIPNIADLAERIARRISENEASQPRPIVNATGILLPPSPGAIPLPEDAAEEMSLVARSYSNGDFEDKTNRSSGNAAAENLLRELTGAEAAFVVQNKACAMMLTLAAVASGREVLVARNQLGESDDGYRPSDWIAAGGATIREVGAVNSIRLEDYVHAIGQSTAAIIAIQTSNYAVVGTRGHVGLRELSDLARPHNLPVIQDAGIGGLLNFTQYGLDELGIGESIKNGADLVLLSGDKLLGGPACGIIVGRTALIEKIERHPLAASMRVAPLTLAALAATLQLYRDAEKAQRTIPLLQLLTTSIENLKNRAERIAPQAAAVPAIAEAQAVPAESNPMGGALPRQQLPTWCVSLQPAAMTVDQFAARLRAGSPSVIGRVEQDRFVFDLRSVFPWQDTLLLSAMEAMAPSDTAKPEPAQKSPD